MKIKLLFQIFLFIGLVFLFFILPRIISLFNRLFEAFRIKKLKTNGVKIPVDLSTCLFSENAYKNEKGTIYNEIIDRLFKNYPQDYYDKAYVRTSVHYNCKIKNKNYHFCSRGIETDSISLQFLFEKQKETGLYLDKKNPNNYYIDLEFLK